MSATLAYVEIFVAYLDKFDVWTPAERIGNDLFAVGSHLLATNEATARERGIGILFFNSNTACRIDNIPSRLTEVVD